MMRPGLPVLLVKRPKFHRLESSSTDRSAVKPTFFCFCFFSLQRIMFLNMHIYIYKHVFFLAGTKEIHMKYCAHVAKNHISKMRVNKDFPGHILFLDLSKHIQI